MTALSNEVKDVLNSVCTGTNAVDGEFLKMVVWSWKSGWVRRWRDDGTRWK